MNQQKPNLPGISVVIIGLNVRRYLHQCIRAVQASNYPRELLEIIYVDSGSSDTSQEIARSYRDVRVLCLNTDKPNAAKGRNAGLNASRFELIQFVDADSYLHPDWLLEATENMQGKTAAVAGGLFERYPNKNIYHRMAGVEWNLRRNDRGWTISEKKALVFGGNVMIKRSAIKKAGGYDELLRAGEDPDLSYRIRQLGFEILRLNQVMASHDINIGSRQQFLKRSRRSGYAYAMLALKYWKEPERFMVRQFFRIVVGALAPTLVLITGALTGYPYIAAILSLLIAFRLIFKTNSFARILNESRVFSLRYNLYLASVVYPQFLGVIDALIEEFLPRRTNRWTPSKPDPIVAGVSHSSSLNNSHIKIGA